MYTQWKKALSLLLAICLLSTLLIGCGSSTASTEDTSESESETTQAEQTSDSEESASTEPSEAAAEDSAEASEESAVSDSGEPTTITVWDTWPAFFQTFDSERQSPADSILLQALEERFNVEFELTIANTEAASELFGIMAAAGDYCDLIYGVSSYYSGGIEKAVTDEIIIDASEMIEAYCPNYSALLEDPDVARALTTDSGYVGGFAMINMEDTKRTTGGLIRGDWLEALGLEVPETTDEFYEVLCAFRDEMGATGALCISSEGKFGSVSAAFAPIGLYVDNGVVKYGTETLKDYYTYMHKLYEEGLVPMDFMSYTESQKAPTELVLNGVTGVITDDYNNFVTYYEESMTDGGYFVALPDLVCEDYDTSNYKGVYTPIDLSNYVSVSTQCEDAAFVGEVLDFCYSEEGELLGDYGQEGYSFEYDEDGNPQYTELITANENGASSGIAVLVYLDGCWPHLRNNNRLLYSLTEREINCRDDWDARYTSSDGTYPESYVSFTEEELDVINTYETDLETYMDEYYLRFLTGEQSVEDDFDSFIAGLETFHIEELLEAYQAAYDRYMER